MITQPTATYATDQYSQQTTLGKRTLTNDFFGNIADSKAKRIKLVASSDEPKPNVNASRFATLDQHATLSLSRCGDIHETVPRKTRRISRSSSMSGGDSGRQTSDSAQSNVSSKRAKSSKNATTTNKRKLNKRAVSIDCTAVSSNNKPVANAKADKGADKSVNQAGAVQNDKTKSDEASKTPNLSEMTEKNQTYKDYHNFLSLLCVVAGREDFITDDLKLPFHQLIRRGQIDRSTESNPHKGVVFVGRDGAGHFHYMKEDGKLSDSYKEKWQIEKTDGLCQTFAIMGYLGKTAGLQPGKFTDNARAALQFLRAHTGDIAKYWRESAEDNYDAIAYDYPLLNKSEIKQDIDVLLDPKNEAFVRRWLSSNITYS